MQLTLSTWGIPTENWGYMRRADHGDVGASNTDQFRLRLLRDSETLSQFLPLNEKMDES